ncbi:hypothetical protein NL108_001005 [Boleophthalmus pectinirostris]|uniref:phospholipase A2 inhibitor and Ly6/PLAUR domain-containing protein-like n=1 Tax=Boleophthalmus pectinirostris TaxID=150288 RepID=UPI00242AFDFE|nr:phospholipase A2 inhibitor and Ly6/PLAUR domain-containing protein-like [Boleophthalmus pectinirostris]KAJ0065019.1 hypothetical protein NL108_001005 [Boleophthalmus pectinirostris]
MSATIVTTVTSGSSSTTTTMKFRGCAMSSLCPAVNQEFSMDTGSTSVLAGAVCCTTDGCNSGDATAPSAPADGSKRCYGCDPVTGVCAPGTICNTMETNCFSSSVLPNGGSSAILVYGCASESLCINNAVSLNTSSLLTGLGTVQGTPTCCTTDNCNVPPTTTTTTTTTAAGATTAGASSVASLLLLQIFALVLVFLC